MPEDTVMLTCLLSGVLAFAFSLGLTPAVKQLAKKIGAIDVPKDERRMHTVPIARLGGLAIFFGFLISVLAFGQIDSETRGILIGALVIVTIGVIDDIKPLKPTVKLLGQILAAMIPAMNNVIIARFTNPFSDGAYFQLGGWAIPVTVLWIVLITNAVNFIDGLDGLAVGVSSIASVTMLVIAVLVSDSYVAIMMAALAGACLGFMPYNLNPAKIFMGDTGAMFLGYILACTSIQGLFKLYALISFAAPIIMLGIPLFDTLFAVVRRTVRGQHMFAADRGHIHHRLIDMGLNQKQAVAVLYALSALLGLAAVVLTSHGETKIMLFAGAVILAIAFGAAMYFFERRQEKREHAGKGDAAPGRLAAGPSDSPDAAPPAAPGESGAMQGGKHE